MSIDSTASFSSKARRLTRRLSYGISRVLKDWNNDPATINSKLAILLDEHSPRVFNIDELVTETKFTKPEIQFIYRDFKLKCPNGILTEKSLMEIYSPIFSCGDTSIFAKHLFSAMIHQHRSRISSMVYLAQEPAEVTEVNFRDFIITLSSIMRGSMDDRIRWLFHFYDINRDGKITIDEISSLIHCMYDLMGPNVNPPADEEVITNHVERVVEKLGLEQKPDKTMTYTEFHKLFSNNHELIEVMMNVF